MKTKQIPAEMKAIVIDRFGGAKNLQQRVVPLPAVGTNDVLIRLEWVGVGEWDPFEREGGFASMLPEKPKFPYILGSEGAGTIVDFGAGVKNFRKGERVYAPGFLNPNGGFYAQFVSVKKSWVAKIPVGMPLKSAAVMAGVALTALRGLDDTLKVQRGESVLIFGASGGLGHLAVQLAKKMGARVLAVASGQDGVDLVKRLGADVTIDGHEEEVVAVAKGFAPDGMDAALFAAGSADAVSALSAIKPRGRIAIPRGVEIPPSALRKFRSTIYDGNPDAEIIRRLNALMKPRPLKVHVDRVFPLARAAQAHQALAKHHLGKLALKIV